MDNIGRLIVSIREDTGTLVTLHNTLAYDVFVWPRIASTHIFEAYMRNVLEQQRVRNSNNNNNSKNKLTKASSQPTTPVQPKSFADSPHDVATTSGRQSKSKVDFDNTARSSTRFMHVVPARAQFHYNYDFIGTNQHPVDKLNEQVYFAFAVPRHVNRVANSSSSSHRTIDNNHDDDDDDDGGVEFSSNMCRFYDVNSPIGFVQESASGGLTIAHLFHYVGEKPPSTTSTSTSIVSSRLSVDRYLASAPSEQFFDSSSRTSYTKTQQQQQTKTPSKHELSLQLSVERLVLALNDDFYSEVYQTEVLRLHADRLKFALDKHTQHVQPAELRQKTQQQSKSETKKKQPKKRKPLAQVEEKLAICVSCEHMQLDNQMFNLDETSYLDAQLARSAQKFDFPVVLMPRAAAVATSASRSAKSLMKMTSYLRSLDVARLVDETAATATATASRFVEVRLLLARCDNGEASGSMRPLDVELCVQPFDIYLEDYLIYNSIRIGLELLDHWSYVNTVSSPLVSSSSNNNDELIVLACASMDALVDPALTCKRVRIGKIDCLVSLQTSLRIYLATYKMPIVFDELQLVGTPWSIMTASQLTTVLTNHYLTGLLMRAGWLLGSLDLIGTPTVFIQQASSGLLDFFTLPYRGLREHGPLGFLRGFSNGSLSLIRNLSSGTITSMVTRQILIQQNNIKNNVWLLFCVWIIIN